MSERTSWNVTTSLPNLTSYIFGSELADMVDEGEDVVVVTADLATSNRLVDFAERHPDRFYNVGIAEQNMMSISAGLAASGHRVFAATFASFASLLCAEHLRTDLAYTKMPVTVLAHHAGIAMGFYGTSHHAIEDIALTRAIPGLCVISPCDAAATRAALRISLDIDGPLYVRLGRGRDKVVYESPPDLSQRRLVQVVEGSDLTIIATGMPVAEAVAAAAELRSEGVSAQVLDAAWLKPFDSDGVVAAALSTGHIVTVEEHNVINGLGTAVAEALAVNGVSAKLARVALQDEYALVAPPTHLYRHYGLSAAGIKEASLRLLRS